MAKTREIKGRIKAVGNIQRITKTMQMIATAKFQAAQRRATATKPYTQKIGELIDQLAAAAGSGGEGDDASHGFTHPLLHAPQPKTGRQLLLVITSNRGLCGGYNGNVLRTAHSLIRQHPEVDWSIEIVGRKGMGYMKFVGLEVEKAHTQFGDEPSYEEVEHLGADYIRRFEAGEFDAIRVVYMQYISTSRQVPTVVQLLPIEQVGSETADEPQADQANLEYDFMPSPEELLGKLLPITVKTRVFQSFNDAIVSEQIARMVAMKAATDNAGQMKRALKQKFNRARQAQITTELTEIISGAAALE